MPLRQALSKLTLPIFMVASFGLMLLGKADALLAERARMAVADALSPLYAALAEPLSVVHRGIEGAQHLATLHEENARLREENDRLRRWQAVALALDAENATLKAQLRWIPDPAPSFLTARVVADAGGVYARAVLLSLGPNHSVARGQIARGHAVGIFCDSPMSSASAPTPTRSARVLLLTDMNSRVPVTLEGSRGRAILAGTNGPRPRLMYWAEGTQPAEGERVVTSAEANAFPPGLPVGVVPYSTSNVPEVVPFARLDRLEVVRLFDYGLKGVIPPEASVARQSERRR